MCHVARRDRILQIPDSVAYPELRNVWGAAGEERMCVRDAPGLASVQVQVFDLARGVLLFTLKEAGPRWCVNPSLGIFMHAPNGHDFHKYAAIVLLHLHAPIVGVLLILRRQRRSEPLSGQNLLSHRGKGKE